MTDPRRLRGLETVPAETGGSESVVALFHREYAPMVRLAFLLTRDQQQAEDVVQEAFLEVQRRWSSLLSPGGYLRTTVVNGCHRWLRREQNRRKILETNMSVVGCDVQHAEDQYLVDLLEHLPERQRVAVVLAYYGGFGPKDIAETLGCRPGTAKSLVHRGIRRLRKELGE